MCLIAGSSGAVGRAITPASTSPRADAESETVDAVKDRNAIRDAVRASRPAPTADEWWQRSRPPRKQNSEHLGEEERGALADLRWSVPVVSRPVTPVERGM